MVGGPVSWGSGTPASVDCFVILWLGELVVARWKSLKIASSGPTHALDLCNSEGQHRVGHHRH